MPKYELSDFLRDFPNEKSAFKYVLRISRPPVNVWKHKKGLGWSTAKGKYYAPLSKTVFKGVRLSLDKWFYAVFLIHYSRFWSVREFKKHIGVSSLQTAFRILKKVRPVVNRKMSFQNNLNMLIRGEKVTGTGR